MHTQKTVIGKKKFRFTQDTVFDIIVAAILSIIILIMAYPIYFVLMASFSDPSYVNNGSMLLWPKGFTLLGYQKVFEDSRIWTGYGNTLIYTIGGTALGTFFYHDGRLCPFQEGSPLPQPAHGIFCIHHVFRRRPDSLLYGN